MIGAVTDVTGAVTAVVGAIFTVIRAMNPTRGAAGAVPAVTAVTAVTFPRVGIRPSLVLRRVSRVRLHRPTSTAEVPYSRVTSRESLSLIWSARRYSDLGCCAVVIVLQRLGRR